MPLMKLRLQGDSLRLRLTQEEVTHLASGQPVRASTKFAEGELELEVAPAGTAVRASFGGGRIVVAAPAARIAEWSASDEEGIYGQSGGCKIAIEKDYACLHKASEAGSFPNPASQGHE